MSRIFRLNGTGPHAPAVDAKLAERVDDLGALARRWFDVIRAAGTDVCEVLHDGYPTATLGDAAFAYVATFKAHVNVGFFHGAKRRFLALGLAIGGVRQDIGADGHRVFDACADAVGIGVESPSTVQLPIAR